MSIKPEATGSATVTGLSHDGRGVSRGEGKTVFIEGALPGERVTYTIKRNRPRFIEAKLLEVLTAAPERIAPPCPHYGRCGGCNLQHLAPEAQLSAKQQHLSDTLHRIGGMQPEHWLEPVRSLPWAYRARARLAVTARKNGQTANLGFRREGSREVEALSVCPVLEPQLEGLIAPLAEAVSRLEHPERLSEVWLASSETGPGIAIQLKIGVHPADREILLDCCQAHGVGVQFSAPDGSWPEPAEALLSRTQTNGPEIRFQPWHFVQANRGVNKLLVEQLIALLEPQSNHHALDLFCGLGNFTLPLAQHCAQVTGIDGDAALVESARKNARNNNMGNVEFLRADLAGDWSRAIWTRAQYDLIVLDPPRAGAAELIGAISRLGAKRICYVSCDAATLARDARLMHECSNLRLKSAGVLDMFPQTSHFESIALFA